MQTVDRWVGWCGTPRTQPDSRVVAAVDDDTDTTVTVGALKAATTALLAGYYVMRFGPECRSPYPFTPPSANPGDVWPGGCFGKWAAAEAVASTLKALPKVPALFPGTPRLVLHTQSNVTSSSTSSPAEISTFAALRRPRVRPGLGAASNALGAVVVLNFANEPAKIAVTLIGSGVVTPQQETQDLIAGGSGPRIPQAPLPMVFELPARGWSAVGVVISS